MAYTFLYYPPLLYMFVIHVGLNLISQSWAKAIWLKPIHIWVLSLFCLYFIAPSIEPESARECGMSAVYIIMTGFYGLVVNSIIYLIFRSKSLKNIKTP